ncbi:NADP-dependent malic enzyme [Patescibacteria group bacterium]|nr:NADP-dependent malic enzyme [Patescibacteria group bacterium]
MNYNEESIKLHQKTRGKIEIKSKVNLITRDDLSLAYTPGVGAVCQEIAKNPSSSWTLTNRANQVAIVTDGSAILGLGDLGPEAAMPVMEGKSIIFKEFADIDAIPLCINTKNTEEIIQFCKNIEPSFAGINLEDISAPRCFEILKRLEEELNIPIFHDDQDGTAIVALAALINACQLTNKDIKTLKIVINGAGAAGIAIAKLLYFYGIRDITLVDSKEIICNLRLDLNPIKQEIIKQINHEKNIKTPDSSKICGNLEDAFVKTDVFIGVSVGNLVSKEMVKSMNANPIILAMANPIPEIMPNDAYAAGAAIVGTGRSDFPNQINNALVFPGIFKGLLENKVKHVTKEMKIATAIAIAQTIQPTKDQILPSITNKKVVDAIAEVIR